jgi:beta-glucanase (GH16 family)
VGPCNPQFSYNLTSCAPAPICKSFDHQFTSTDGIVKNTKYLGDASSYDFVVNNDILSFDGTVLLPMANGSTGTVLTSTRAVWYGKISATLKTARTQGVVSSFILMSGVRDEIDYEFIGSFLESAQTNYYWQEHLDYTHSRNVSLSNTFENFHTYEIDWTPDSITWSIDGQASRVLKHDDTYNATTKNYDFPQTPSFLQISIWPGGLASNPEGTRNWAGGYVNWDAEDIKDPGYFYVTLKDVKIECYDPPSNVKKSGDKSYKYTDLKGLSSNVEISGDDTVLGSFDAVGFDMKKGSDENLATVAGSVPTGVGSNNHQSAQNDQNVGDASAVSISSKATSTASLAEVSGSAQKKTTSKSESLAAASGTDSNTATAGATSNGETNSAATDAAESSAAPTSTTNGGFKQSTEQTTSAGAAGASNSGEKLVVGGMLSTAMLIMALLV